MCILHSVEDSNPVKQPLQDSEWNQVQAYKMGPVFMPSKNSKMLTHIKECPGIIKMDSLSKPKYILYKPSPTAVLACPVTLFRHKPLLKQ